MSPRPYRLGRRQPAAQRTRARVLRAARELLTARAGAEPFSVDAVARRAGVARMTVYHQFGSRRGLLEALFDSFAVGGELPARSEEHTSELQSQSNLLCRLLLEKKRYGDTPCMSSST